MGVKQTAPSRTATLYRVAYRRADRDPRKGYTYKVFKGEHQARSFIDRLTAPPDDKTPAAYRDLAPMDECHLHVGIVRWEAVDAGARNDLLDHTGQVLIGGEYVTVEQATQRLEFLSKAVALDEEWVGDRQLAEIDELTDALS